MTDRPDLLPGPTRVLLLPGLYDSGPEHWQSHWERSNPGFVRVVQDDWDTPLLNDWLERLDEAIAVSGPGVVLVAHSTACALIAAWGADPAHRVRGALLVGPSDTEAASYPAGPRGFVPMPMARIVFPTLVVASANDEYVTMARAAEFAEAWGSRLVSVGSLGHINSASALGSWPLGRALLEELLANPQAAKEPA
jgi:uncharacterized protein